MNESISTFISERLPDNGTEEDVISVCQEVREVFGAQCVYGYAGGFDSPGYDIYCYAIAFVGKDGNLGMVTHTHEIY